MACDLSVTDYLGRLVELQHSNWEKHRPRHPEVVPYHDRIAEVLRDPDVVVEVIDRGQWAYYRLGLTDGRYQGNYIRVTVEFYAHLGGSGRVKTCWLPKEIDARGELRWMRKSGR